MSEKYKGWIEWFERNIRDTDTSRRDDAVCDLTYGSDPNNIINEVTQILERVMTVEEDDYHREKLFLYCETETDRHDITPVKVEEATVRGTGEKIISPRAHKEAHKITKQLVETLQKGEKAFRCTWETMGDQGDNELDHEFIVSRERDGKFRLRMMVSADEGEESIGFDPENSYLNFDPDIKNVTLGECFQITRGADISGTHTYADITNLELLYNGKAFTCRKDSITELIEQEKREAMDKLIMDVETGKIPFDAMEKFIDRVREDAREKLTLTCPQIDKLSEMFNLGVSEWRARTHTSPEARTTARILKDIGSKIEKLKC